MSIHEFMRSMRESRGLSLADVANSVGIGRAAVWRAETPPYLLKGSTMQAVLRGLKLQEGGKEWSRALSLWTAARTGNESASLDRLMGRISQLRRDQLRELQAWLDERK